MQSLIIAALCAAPAVLCLRSLAALDPDIWWHLRTGEWILQHHAVPRTDSFSSFAAGKPWLEYSWLFDIIAFKAFLRNGLVGINVLTAALVSFITAACYHLVRRQQADFTVAVLLTCLCWRGLMPLYTPRSWLFSVLFFVLELDVLLNARSTGKRRELVLLPLLFVLWANLHIQFINGLLILGLAAVEALVGRGSPRYRSTLAPTSLLLTCLGCGLATLLNPYGWRIYRVAYDLATQPGALRMIQELQSPTFRSSASFILPFAAIAAAFGMGWHRKVLIFEWLLLSYAVLASFRSQRDLWILVISSVALLASSIVIRSQAPESAGYMAFGSTAVIVFLVLAFGSRLMHVDNELLASHLSKTMPVKAVADIQEHHYPGPIFNTYNWGGYLIWTLRYPVNIDGRAALHGDEHLSRSFSTWDGEPNWRNDPELATAALVVGPVKEPLVQLLRMDPRFRLAYEDKVAAVFVAREAGSN